MRGVITWVMGVLACAFGLPGQDGMGWQLSADEEAALARIRELSPPPRLDDTWDDRRPEMARRWVVSPEFLRAVLLRDRESLGLPEAGVLIEGIECRGLIDLARQKIPGNIRFVDCVFGQLDLSRASISGYLVVAGPGYPEDETLAPDLRELYMGLNRWPQAPSRNGVVNANLLLRRASVEGTLRLTNLPMIEADRVLDTPPGM